MTASTSGANERAAPPEEMYNYVVTAHKPTAVHATAVATFTGPDDINLIISKCTRLEIHRLTADGLQGVVDVPIYGRISAIKVFRPSEVKKDLLLVATERFKYFVLEWDEATQKLITRSAGDSSERTGRRCDRGHFVIVDPECRAIALHQYDGILKIIPMDPRTGALREMFVTRLEERSVIDINFMHGSARPAVAVLHEDARSLARSIKTYEISIGDSDLVEGPWEFKNLDAGATMVIPVQKASGGGAIVVGENTVAYCNRGVQKAEAMDSTFFRCWAPVDEDGSRFLLADFQGTLYLLVVVHDGQGFVSLKLTKLGVTSEARALSYLDNGICFIGSATGDSQLIRACPNPVSPDQPNNYIEVLESFTNLGPIVDFAVVDLDKSGQSQLVTCSGTGRDGSLRLVRNGIGITEQASIEVEGIRGVWSMKASTMDEHDKFLVLTFVEATHVLAINESDELDEAAIPGFDTDSMTLYAGTMDNDQLVQVTPKELRLVDSSSRELVSSWQTPGQPIAKVTCSEANSVLLSTGKGDLFLLETGLQGVKLVASSSLPEGTQIACIDIAPWMEPDGRRIAVVGTWQGKLIVLSLPDLSVKATHELNTEVIPRSALLMTAGTEHLLLLGMGDGVLVHWRITGDAQLENRKQVSLGMKPIALRSFTMAGQKYVFAASDRPTVVLNNNGKLQYSHLNESDITYLASFSSEAFPGALAISKENSLMISTIDAIQKLHIRKIPLGEQPRRIVHQASTSTFGVATCSITMFGDSSCVRVLHQVSWETIATFPLDSRELANTICTLTHKTGDQVKEYFVVGTAYVHDEEPEPTKGRVLVLHLDSTPEGGKTLTLVAEKVVKGSVYQARAVEDKLLLTVNTKICIFSLAPHMEDGKLELTVECSHTGKVLAMYLDVRGCKFVVGDLMRSLALYQYLPEEQRLELVAEDYEGKWITAVCMLDDRFYMAAENEFNLFVVRHNADAASDEVLAHLDTVGTFHLGDFVNRVRRGSLVMQLPDSDFAGVPVHIMGTINGAVSIVVSLPKALFQQLAALEGALRGRVQGVGGLSHAEWRSSFSADVRVTMTPCVNFVDGDLIEQALDLPRDEITAINDTVPEAQRLPVDELLKVIEDLARLH